MSFPPLRLFTSEQVLPTAAMAREGLDRLRMHVAATPGHGSVSGGPLPSALMRQLSMAGALEPGSNPITANGPVCGNGW